MGRVEWRCWITSDGHRYVWRAEGDRLLAGQRSGSHVYWARVDGKFLPKTYASLKDAMSGAFREMMMARMKTKAVHVRSN
jgi:hypothetical protein